MDIAGDADDRQVARMNAMLGMLKQKDDALLKRIDVVIKTIDLEKARVEADAKRRDAGGLEGASGNGGASPGRAVETQKAA
jgi:hypothetical protein